jgi:hypothetical protein
MLATTNAIPFKNIQSNFKNTKKEIHIVKENGKMLLSFNSLTFSRKAG